MRPAARKDPATRRWLVMGALALSILLLVGALPAAAVDTDKPYVEKYTPADGASNVEIDAVVTLDFSEDIRSSNLDSHITIKDGRGFQVDKRVDYSNLTFRAIVTPEEPLKYSMLYVVSVSSFIQDQAGNPLLEPIQWTFNTTKEKTPPQIVDTSPSDGADGVSINSTISVTFSEEMDVESLLTGIVVHDSLENPVIGNTTPALDGMSVKFDPLFSYGYGQQYHVTVLQTVKDLAGNNLAAEHGFSFTVQLEQIPPRMVLIDPPEQAQFVGRNTKISVTFSEPMNSTSLANAIVIKDPGLEVVPTTPQYNADNYTLMVKPDTPLEYQTLYTITILQSAQDLAGNFLDKEYHSSFTTEKLPQQPPRITQRVPAEEEFNWYEGIAITFNVDADDPNDDILVYAWEVNGDVREGETFQEFIFYPEPGSEGRYMVRVSVMDGITAPVQHFWVVNVVQSEPPTNGGPGTEDFNWTYVGIIIIIVIVLGVLLFGYWSLMERKREIQARTRRRLRPLSFKKKVETEKPPSYEEMYLRTDSVYSKKSPEFKPVAAPGGAKVKGKAAKEAVVQGPVMGQAPQLLKADEVEVRSARTGPYTTAAPELKKTRAPGALVCPKCGQKAIEAAHGRVWCDTCGFVE
ncbi:MAG: Ig-like domain-containing protein [Thermoplasmata archaeon]|nr:MAG: Ig-like domain-containing protein [Thermoplasmata archaeon]